MGRPKKVVSPAVESVPAQFSKTDALEWMKKNAPELLARAEGKEVAPVKKTRAKRGCAVAKVAKVQKVKKAKKVESVKKILLGIWVDPRVKAKLKKKCETEQRTITEVVGGMVNSFLAQ
jgi:hypothetical protein